MQSKVYRTKVDTPGELLSCILHAAACIKKREDHLRRTTRDLRTGIAKCTEVDVGIFEYCVKLTIIYFPLLPFPVLRCVIPVVFLNYKLR